MLEPYANTDYGINKIFELKTIRGSEKMSIHTIRAISFTFIFSMLAGCATTRIEGQKYRDIGQPVTAIRIQIAQSGAAKVQPGSLSINETLNDTIPLLRQRLPTVFLLNGINSDSSGGTRYELTIAPTSAKYQSYGGHVELLMTAWLTDASEAKHVTIWRGSITFRRPGFSQVNEAVADDFAKRLLAKLAEDGIISKKPDEIITPSR